MVDMDKNYEWMSTRKDLEDGLELISAAGHKVRLGRLGATGGIS